MTDQEKNNFDEMTKEEKKEAKKLRDKEIEADIEAEIEESLERRFGGGCDGDNPWWDDRALPVKIVMGFGFGVLAIGLGAVAILVVMKLWNWLMPEIFGLTTLTYWKAGGLLLLTSILFKNWNIGDKDSKSERRRKRELKRYINEEEENN
jgi:hypothetical protein